MNMVSNASNPKDFTSSGVYKLPYIGMDTVEL